MTDELMMERIDRAQREIQSKKELVKYGRMRQHYHFMGETGWINDPNGLIFYQGKYHFFYQFNPYYGFWDYMHWGHAVSEDLVHWEYLPIALAPSQLCDDHMRGGCFSGSAIVHDGKLFLMYTGTTNEGRGFDQTQCIAWSEDGIHFQKYEGNPVLRAPEGIPTWQFRDPKVWEHDGTYYMVCGASKNNMAQARLYRSKDMLHWEFFNVLAESRGEWGYMWECPDFYPLGDRYVLMVSPMGAGERTVVYFTGDFDYATGKFSPQKNGEIDWGYDYYAPQSFLAPDGRRLIVAWANNWDWMPFWKDWGPAYKEGWCGFFNIPREVQLRADGSLRFVPVRELEAIRTEERRVPELTAGEEPCEILAGDGVAFEWKMKIDLAATDARALVIELRRGEGPDAGAPENESERTVRFDSREEAQRTLKKTVLRFDFARAEMSVDRNEGDGWSVGVSRSTMNLAGKKELDVHIFSDQSSLEIFTDDYSNNHSMNVYASSEQNGIRIYAEGGTARITDMQSWGMEECFR